MIESASPVLAGDRADVWVTPPLDGEPTGGTLFDDRMIRALAARGAIVSRLGPEAALSYASARAATFWVDSLYLELVPLLAHRTHGRTNLVAHYLPSLVGQAERHAITDVERAAIHAAALVVAPSPWLSDVLVSAGAPRARVVVVEPGTDVLVPLRAPAPLAPGEPLRVVLVANVVPAKGIAPFLVELERALEAAPCRPLAVTVVGSLEADAEYARGCVAAVSAHPRLRGIVQFTGSASPERAQELVAKSHVAVSTSRMESYGMALAEARALGVPVLVRRGGNAGAHAVAAAGGETFEDERALCRALVCLACDDAVLSERRQLAFAARRSRSWDDAARELTRGAAPS